MTKMRRIFTSFLTICVLVVSLSASEAEARRRRRSHRRARRLKIINEKKLYERIGGAKMMTAIVDEWTRINLADSRVSGGFASVTTKPEKLGHMRKALGDQLCEIADGPCQYHGQEMKKVHRAFQISDDQFLIVSDNLVQSLAKLGIPEREKNELLARLGELRLDIVQDNH